MTARKSTAAEKATAARLRDLKHIAEVAISRPSRGSESSVSVTRNAKGQWQFSLEITHPDVNIARDTAIAVAQQLEEAFPFNNGGE